MSFELDDSFDAASRELCPDGACTGVLDASGVCKLCGARGTPALRIVGASTAPDGDESADFLARRPAPSLVAALPATGADGDEAAFDDADDQRQLCPDGSCIGVLDSSGRCKECGRTLAR